LDEREQSWDGARSAPARGLTAPVIGMSLLRVHMVSIVLSTDRLWPN
jgi:hypothetical protein